MMMNIFLRVKIDMIVVGGVKKKNLSEIIGGTENGGV
tara:strand:- start:697 stop:807 length:111 start_codon:yes stop_codon:yes gene_type:complete